MRGHGQHTREDARHRLLRGQWGNITRHVPLMWYNAKVLTRPAAATQLHVSPHSAHFKAAQLQQALQGEQLGFSSCKIFPVSQLGSPILLATSLLWWHTDPIKVLRNAAKRGFCPAVARQLQGTGAPRQQCTSISTMLFGCIRCHQLVA